MPLDIQLLKVRLSFADPQISFCWLICPGIFLFDFQAQGAVYTSIAPLRYPIMNARTACVGTLPSVLYMVRPVA